MYKLYCLLIISLCIYFTLSYKKEYVVCSMRATSVIVFEVMQEKSQSALMTMVNWWATINTLYYVYDHYSSSSQDELTYFRTKKRNRVFVMNTYHYNSRCGLIIATLVVVYQGLWVALYLDIHWIQCGTYLIAIAIRSSINCIQRVACYSIHYSKIWAPQQQWIKNAGLTGRKIGIIVRYFRSKATNIKQEIIDEMIACAMHDQV